MIALVTLLPLSPPHVLPPPTPTPTIQCDYKRVRDELNKFSDYDLHQICTQYPDKLKPLELLPEDLYSSQKMIKVRPLSNPYLAPI